MKILVFTTLYPNSIQPRHGIFVEARLLQLLATGQVSATVIAPVPWFPFKSTRFGMYGQYAQIPKKEVLNGIEVYHPRYLVLPKIGMNVAPYSLYFSVKRFIGRLLNQSDEFDLIDAHYFYPDGVAAVKLGNAIHKPVVITARGTDINLIPQYSLPRAMISNTIRLSDGIITVCEALKQKIVSTFATSPERITVLRNGVDTELFKVLDRERARSDLGVTGRMLLSVGNLVELKGHDLAIRALAEIPDISLYIAGDGPERDRLGQLAAELGIKDRVFFLGTLTQKELVSYYNAADALLLLSSREGWANVLLESMACGTPVIATAVGGTPEVVAGAAAGVLIEERNVAKIIAGIQGLLRAPPERRETRRYAEGFSWQATTQGQLALYKRLIGLATGQSRGCAKTPEPFSSNR